MRILLILTLLLFQTQVHANLTLEEKVRLLYQEDGESKKADKFIVELTDFCTSLEKYRDLAPKKKVKKVFVATKSTFLRRYKLRTHFSEIGSFDTYNCVTGSALLAIIFDELDIPYAVVEVPRHVYLIAYPTSYAIGVESTDLKDGVYYWTEYNKRQAVSFLIATEEVSEREVQLKGVNAIIEEFFYTNDQLDFEALIGIYYFNCSLYALDDEDYKTALNYIRTSVGLYTNERNNFMMRTILRNMIADSEFDDVSIVNYITLYYDLTEKKSEKDRMEATFNYVYQEALQTRRDFGFTDTSVIYVKRNLQKETDRNLFLSQTELITATWHSIRGNTSKALAAAKKGYHLNPSNFQFQDFIPMLIIEETLREEPDTDVFLDSIASYETQFPFIWENENFSDMVVLYFSFAVSDLFLGNTETYGLEVLAALEATLIKTKFDSTKVTATEVAEAYSQVGTYYYRRKNYQEALVWIKKAEHLDPASESIIYKAKQIRLKAN